MKLIFLCLLLVISLPSLGNTQKLNFLSPELPVKLVITKPIPTNLIRLYNQPPSQKRMIAGFKEDRIKTLSWLDGLRDRLKTTSGRISL